MEGCIVANATAKSPVWVHFGFPGNADGTVMTIISAAKKRRIRTTHHITIKQYIAIIKGTVP